MHAHIIVVTNQKGGTGKTTVTMQLAGAIARREQGVLVIDADPQGTATRWAAAAPDEKPFPAHVSGLSAAGGKVHREIQKFVNNYDYILVDCPPAIDSTVPQSALLVADLALVPMIPSPPDLWAGIGIRRLIENISAINEGLVARIVPNMCQPHTAVAREALRILDEFGIACTRSRLSIRTANRQAAMFGGTVHDLGATAAAARVELEALTDEVLELLQRPALKAAANG